MKSPIFNFRVPTQSKAYSWIKEKEDAGENVSRAIRLLIETHSEMFDKLDIANGHIVGLRRRIEQLERRDSPDFRANLEAEKNMLARVRARERAAFTADHTAAETEQRTLK